MAALTAPDRHRWRHFRKLTEVSRALTYLTSADDVNQLAVRTACELLGAERAGLLLADATGEICERAARGLDDDALAAIAGSLDGIALGRMLELFGGDWEQSVLSVPLAARGQVIGVLCVGAAPGRRFEEQEEWALSALADQAALAIEHARLREGARARASDRQSIRPLTDSGGNLALATLAHDVRSGLNAVEAYAELMDMEIYGPVTAKQREALARIRASSGHIVGVVENVLEMARLTAGSVRVRPDSVRASRVMEEAELILRPTALARRHVVELDPGPDPVLWVDPDRLRQVLVNLLSNAIKFMPPGGRIRMSATLIEDRIGDRRLGAISVTDSGPGIPQERFDEVFRPYSRLSEGGDDGTSGAGLGLAICRELVRQMKGEIDLRSPPGEGATFVVHLPLLEGRPPPAAA